MSEIMWSVSAEEQASEAYDDVERSYDIHAPAVIRRMFGTASVEVAVVPVDGDTGRAARVPVMYGADDRPDRAATVAALVEAIRVERAVFEGRS